MCIDPTTLPSVYRSSMDVSSNARPNSWSDLRPKIIQTALNLRIPPLSTMREMPYVRVSPSPTMRLMPCVGASLSPAMRDGFVCLFPRGCVFSRHLLDWNISISCRALVSPRSIVCWVTLISLIPGFSWFSRTPIKSIIRPTDKRIIAGKLDIRIHLVRYDFNRFITQFSIRLFIYFHI